MEPLSPPPPQPTVLWLTKGELQDRMTADGYQPWQIWHYCIISHKLVVDGDLKFKWLVHFQ